MNFIQNKNTYTKHFLQSENVASSTFKNYSTKVINVQNPTTSNEKNMVTDFLHNSTVQCANKKNVKLNNNLESTSNTSGSIKRKHKSKNLTDTSEEDSDAVIMAISEGRGYARGEIGIAAVDSNRPHLILCQFSDSIWYTGLMTKISMLNPIEILLPNTLMSQNSETKLVSYIRSIYPQIPITPIPRRHFNDSDAIVLIQSLCSPKHESVKFQILQKFYALAAAGALLKYLKFVRSIIFADKSMKIDYQAKYATMLIDIETCHRLELLYPLCQTRETKTCLFGVLNFCMTGIGKRTLRTRILQPSCDIPTLKATHECIQDLMKKEAILHELQVNLKNFANIDRLLKLSIIIPQDNNVKSAKSMISQALLLKLCLENVPVLKEIIDKTKAQTFTNIRDSLNDHRYPYILEKINSVLSCDAYSTNNRSQFFQRLYAVKPNINELLDITRELYSKTIDKISDIVKSLSDEYNVPLNVIHTVNRGFHIQLTLLRDQNLPCFPDDFEIISKKGYHVIFTTSEITKLNFEIKDIIEEIQIMSNVIISNLLMHIRDEIDVIYQLTGLITELDIYQSLTMVSKRGNFCCPTFGEELKVVDAVHPFLEFSRQRPIPTANNIIATPEYNFYIITGPNMGGKTIYLKTIAILQIMFQLGCFIPATSAQFRICDKLFSRIGFEDKFDQGASSFVVEIREMEYILTNVTPNSLVIIDELCRSTNPVEGQILAWKLSEKLLCMKGIYNDGNYYKNANDSGNHTNSYNDESINNTFGLKRTKLQQITSPFVFLATHFLELTKLSEQYYNVINLHLAAEETRFNDKSRLNFLHKVKEGCTPLSKYGLALASCIPFPSEVMPRAEEILNEISGTNFNFVLNLNESGNVENNKTDSFNVTTDSVKVSTLERKLYDLYSNIITLERRHIEESSGSEKIQTYLKQFVENQNDEFISIIRNRDIKEYVNISCDISINLQHSYPPESDINQSKTTTGENTVHTNLSDLSYHSIKRRMNEQENKYENSLERAEKQVCLERKHNNNNDKEFMNDVVEFFGGEQNISLFENIENKVVKSGDNTYFNECVNIQKEIPNTSFSFVSTENLEDNQESLQFSPTTQNQMINTIDAMTSVNKTNSNTQSFFTNNDEVEMELTFNKTVPEQPTNPSFFHLKTKSQATNENLLFSRTEENSLLNSNERSCINVSRTFPLKSERKSSGFDNFHKPTLITPVITSVVTTNNNTVKKIANESLLNSLNTSNRNKIIVEKKSYLNHPLEFSDPNQNSTISNINLVNKNQQQSEPASKVNVLSGGLRNENFSTNNINLKPNALNVSCTIVDANDSNNQLYKSSSTEKLNRNQRFFNFKSPLNKKCQGSSISRTSAVVKYRKYNQNDNCNPLFDLIIDHQNIAKSSSSSQLYLASNNSSYISTSFENLLNFDYNEIPKLDNSQLPDFINESTNLDNYFETENPVDYQSTINFDITQEDMVPFTSMVENSGGFNQSFASGTLKKDIAIINIDSELSNDGSFFNISPLDCSDDFINNFEDTKNQIVNHPNKMELMEMEKSRRFKKSKLKQNKICNFSFKGKNYYPQNKYKSQLDKNSKMLETNINPEMIVEENIDEEMQCDYIEDFKNKIDNKDVCDVENTSNTNKNSENMSVSGDESDLDIEPMLVLDLDFV